jgi:hypothetical protein
MPQIGNRRAVIRQNIGRGGGQWSPKGESPNTEYGRAQRSSGQPTTATPGPKPVMPWDVAAANSEAVAGKRLGNSMTGLDAGWLATEQDYGLDSGFSDPASNPYSRATLLQRSYDNAKQGTLNSAGNQLYSGSYINHQNQNTFQFNRGRDELQKAYGAAHAQYIRERQEAQDAFNEEIAQAGWNRVNAGLESQPEPMPVSGGGGKSGGGRRKKIRQNISQARKA